MKLFDVMVYDAKRMQDVVYRASVMKREAKKLVEELKKKGFKSHSLTARNRTESNLRLEEAEPEYSEND